MRRLIFILLLMPVVAIAQPDIFNSISSGIETSQRVYDIQWICTGDTVNKQIDEVEQTIAYTMNGYYITRGEITQELWTTYMPYNPSKVKGEQLPVTDVERASVDSFLTKLTSYTGMEWRLPTREEWLFAYEGGLFSEGYRFSGSDNLDFVAWSASNSDGKPHPTEQLIHNEVYLYDMLGNVAEMVTDGEQTVYLGGSYADYFSPTLSKRKKKRKQEIVTIDPKVAQRQPAAGCYGFRIVCPITMLFKDFYTAQ